MEIEKTPLYKEAMSIIQHGEAQANVGWKAIIHLGITEETYIPLQVVAVNIRRDYNLAYADEMTCTLLIPLGKYSRKIYPNRNDLQITLIKTSLKGNTASINRSKDTETERYSATLLDDCMAIAEGKGKESNDEATLDLHGIADIHFQLYSKAVEQVRMMTVGGVFRQTKLDQVILGILTKESSKAKVDDKKVITGVDLIPISNSEKKEHVVITHGIKVIDLPNYLQNKYGIYNAGLGSYIQNNVWYVFPMYDTTQFEKREKTLTILVLPSSKLPELERSFRKNGDSLVILVSSDTGFKDDSGTQYLNDGNGARLGNANKYLESFSTTKDNKTTISRTKNNSEFITDTKPDNLNHVNVAGERITANPYTVYSNLLSRNGGVFQCIWENSSPNLIIPGMITKIIYFDKNEIKELIDVTLGVKHTSMKVGDMNTLKHTTNSSLSIFVNRKI